MNKIQNSFIIHIINSPYNFSIQNCPQNTDSTLHNVCAVHQGVCGTLGDVQYTKGISYSGGYHEYTGGVQYTGRYHDKCGGRSLQKQLNLYGNPTVLNIPWCTHDIPHTHHGIPQCTHGIPQCTHGIPPLY